MSTQTSVKLSSGNDHIPPISPFDRLMPVWPLIIDLLVPGAPKPLSGVTKQEYCGNSPGMFASLPDENAAGATSRKDIRAGDLATLMRVSLAFNHLAARKLYRKATVDNLSGLFVGFGKPSAHLEVPSKAELLSYVIQLHLEYGRKGDGPVYPAILQNTQQWQAVGCLDRVQTATVETVLETCRYTETLFQLKPFNSTSPAHFPHLNTLTVGAVFGGQDRLWQTVALSEIKLASHPGSPCETDVEQSIAICAALSYTIFCRSPILHFCQRGSCGPLSWPSIYDMGPSTPSLPSAAGLFTLHYGFATKVPFPKAIGHKTRWVIENDRRAASTTKELSDKLYDALDLAAKESAERGSGKAIDIEVYASTPRVEGPRNKRLLGPEEERAELKRVGEKVQATRRKQGKADSKFLTSWKSSVDTPPCKACGWVFEQ